MKKIFIVLCLLFSPVLHAEDWITEEVLKQLSEVRQELKSLKEEVRGLKSQLSQKPPVQAKQAKLAAISLEGSPILGSDKAKIGIIEFSDYQCPYCKRHYKQTFPEIDKNYIETGKVKYVMKQFPLGFHAKAKGASIAALCMENIKPGAYWDAHKSIFDGDTKLNNVSYKALAKSLNVDLGKFQSCLDDPKTSEIIDEDMAAATAAGVTGTPAFIVGEIVGGKLVNGRLVTGARPYNSFSQVLNELL